jgi:hypothetical protein
MADAGIPTSSSLLHQSAQLLAFEAFRDLVKTAGQSEAAGLAAALEENLRLRAVARAAANDGSGLTAARQRAPIASPATPAGSGRVHHICACAALHTRGLVSQLS